MFLPLRVDHKTQLWTQRMEFTIQREQLLRPLQMAVGVAGRNTTLPILSNVLLVVKKGCLSLTATDLELEIVACSQVLEMTSAGGVTVQARKLYDICRSLEENAVLSFSLKKDNLAIESEVANFCLSVLPTEQFPNIDITGTASKLQLKQQDLLNLIQATQFSMANQDVRYYLNGLLLQFRPGFLLAIATDGHRLAYSKVADSKITQSCQVIVPRKGIIELARLLVKHEDLSNVLVTDNHIQIITETLTFTSKLINAPVPNYEAIIPQTSEQALVIDRVAFKNALTRVAILSNEENKGVRLQINDHQLHIQTKNEVHEQAQEAIGITYTGDQLRIEFNVNYLLDVLNVIDSPEVKLSFSNANGGVLIQAGTENCDRYVVMPMM